jgi:hypothetical protein
MNRSREKQRQLLQEQKLQARIDVLEKRIETLEELYFDKLNKKGTKNG